MTMEFFLRLLLDHKVRFRTAGNAEMTGEVSILGNGRVGILTQREKFSANEVKRVRMVE